jgi:hypothetical protein
MHRVTRRSVLVLVVLGALFAGGAAYTAGLGTAPTNQIGYANETVAGATLASVDYGFNADGSQVDTVTLGLSGGPYTNQKLEVGLGTGAQPVSVCYGDGTVASHTGIILDATATPSITCDLTTSHDAGATPTDGIDSASATSLKVLVTNAP